MWSEIQQISTPDTLAFIGVRIWQVQHTLPVPVATYHALLSQDEQQRARRFQCATRQRQFILTRAALRHLLAKQLNCTPQYIEFTYSQTGQPTISRPATTLQFSLSHADSLSLIACVDTLPIGVDIEDTPQAVFPLPIDATLFCPQERKRLGNGKTPVQRTLFYRYWVTKEAILKMLGSGFSLAPHHFCVTHLTPGSTVIRSGKTGKILHQIRIMELDISDNLAAAVALFLPGH